MPVGKIFPSQSTEFQAVVDKAGTSFSVFNKDQKKLYSTAPNPNLKLGTLFVANDGLHVVWMLSSHFYGKPSPGTYDLVPALLFYENGKILKTYSLAQLLIRTNLVKHSTAHIQWIMEKRKPDLSFEGDAVSFQPDGRRFEIETTSFRKYVFKPKTGEMILGEDSPVYQKADLIVEGNIPHVSGRLSPTGPCSFDMAIMNFIKGELKSKDPLHVIDETCSYTTENFPATVALRSNNKQWWLTDPIYSTP